MTSRPATIIMFRQSLGDETMQAIERLGVEVLIPKTDDEAMALLPEIEAFTGIAIPPDWLERAEKLKWIQATSGLDTFFYPALRASPVVVTQVRAIYSDLIADHVLGFMLSFSRGLHRFLRRQWERRWDRDVARPGLLAGQRLGILGLGGIGLEVAHRAHAFGMHIRALDPAPKGRPEYVERIHAPSELRTFLTDLDFLVVAAPLTPETERMLGAAALRVLKPTTYLINVGRAKILDMVELRAALKDGRLAGAALDVFEKDPLPEDDPLWTMENVLITPHIAAASPLSRARRDRAVIENVRRYRAGEPLLDVVDKALGYVV